MPESLDKLRPSWIAFGWFIAAAITSAVLLGLISLGVITEDPQGAGVSVAAAFVIGFGLAGFLVGARAGGSPILHGLGMGLFSLIVFILANLLAGEPTGQTAWRDMGYATAFWFILLQTVSAIVGARLAIRLRKR